MNILNKFISFVFLGLFLVSCQDGFKLPKPGDARKMEVEGQARARKNVEEKRGFSLIKSLGGRGSTNYEFSTSNPLWRATFDVIDFMPLVTVDYSGGMIITDWYTDSNTSNDSLKFTIRFLSNEIRADSLKIVVHKKRCSANNSCKMSLLPADSQIKSELRSVILRKASLIEKASKGKKSNKKN